MQLGYRFSQWDLVLQHQQQLNPYFHHPLLAIQNAVVVINQMANRCQHWVINQSRLIRQPLSKVGQDEAIEPHDVLLVGDAGGVHGHGLFLGAVLAIETLQQYSKKDEQLLAEELLLESDLARQLLCEAFPSTVLEMGLVGQAQCGLEEEYFLWDMLDRHRIVREVHGYAEGIGVESVVLGREPVVGQQEFVVALAVAVLQLLAFADGMCGRAYQVGALAVGLPALFLFVLVVIILILAGCFFYGDTNIFVAAVLLSQPFDLSASDVVDYLLLLFSLFILGIVVLSAAGIQEKQIPKIELTILKEVEGMTLDNALCFYPAFISNLQLVICTVFVVLGGQHFSGFGFDGREEGAVDGVMFDLIELGGCRAKFLFEVKDEMSDLVMVEMVKQVSKWDHAGGGH